MGRGERVVDFHLTRLHASCFKAIVISSGESRQHKFDVLALEGKVCTEEEECWTTLLQS